MDTPCHRWYISDMPDTLPIPVFTLFGETEHFPDVVHCEEISARAPEHDWRISAHRHAQMAQLFLIEKGLATAVVDGHTVALRPLYFLYIPAQRVHEIRFEPNTKGMVISFPNSVVQTIGPTSDDIQTALSDWLIGTNGTDVLDLAGLLSKTTQAYSIFRAQKAVGLAHALLGLVADRAANAGRVRTTPSTRVLLRLDQLITSHIGDGWRVSDYASALSISAGHLSRLCRAASGCGASIYIERAIMDEACRLLAFTQLPISEIGYRLGFCDPSHFTKRFKAVRQTAPSDYRSQFSA